MLELVLNVNAWLALLMLVFLEIILGIDNIVFLSIITGKLKKEEQPKARKLGLFFAFIFRIIMLLGITWVLKMKESFLDFDFGIIKGEITGQSLIVIFGGIFLLWESVNEIHHKLEGEENIKDGKTNSNFTKVIIQFALLNIVFSFDSILTAIGMVSADDFGYIGSLIIMIIAVLISIIIMIIFAKPVSEFVNEHPTVQILGLSFLILIGVMLLAEGSHLANIVVGNKVHVSSIPKAYLYFAIFFSLFVEFLNIRVRNKSSKPVKLHDNEYKE